MSIVIVGGHDRMVCQYKKICKQFLEKLVDCLEKCLICRHIRRFAD